MTFDLKRKKNTLPEWVSNGSDEIRTTYNYILESAAVIEAKIEKREKLTPRQMKISKTDVARSIGKNPAYINERDHPNLYDFINLVNASLGRKYATQSKGRNRRSAETRKGELDKLSRVELLKECRIRGAKIDELLDESAKASLAVIYAEAMSTERFGNSSYVRTLEQQLDDANSAIENMQETVRRLRSELVQLSAENALVFKGPKRKMTSKKTSKPDLKTVK